MAVSFMVEEDEGAGERDFRRGGGGRSAHRLSTASSAEGGDDGEPPARGGNQRRPRRKHLATEAVEAFTENEELHTKLIQLEELNNELLAENEQLKARAEAAAEARAVPQERKQSSVTFSRNPSVSEGAEHASVVGILKPSKTSSFDEDHTKQLDELHKKLDDKEDENEKLREKVHSLESSCSDLRKTLETENKQLTAQNYQLQNEQTRLQTESSELEERVANLEMELTAERERSREAMVQLREELEAVQSNQMPSRRPQSISKGNANDLFSQMTRSLDVDDDDEEDPPALEPVPAPEPRKETTEATPTPELCSFVEGCPVPDRIRGHLSKKSPSTFRSLWPYQRRLCLLERGRLGWWDADHATMDPTECKGSLDFTANPCCLEEDEVDLDRFSIRPLEGTWFAGSFTGANSGRVLEFNVKNSEHSREHWMQVIRDHVEYGKKRRALLEERSGH